MMYYSLTFSMRDFFVDFVILFDFCFILFVFFDDGTCKSGSMVPWHFACGMALCSALLTGGVHEESSAPQEGVAAGDGTLYSVLIGEGGEAVVLTHRKHHVLYRAEHTQRAADVLLRGPGRQVPHKHLWSVLQGLKHTDLAAANDVPLLLKDEFDCRTELVLHEALAAVRQVQAQHVPELGEVLQDVLPLNVLRQVLDVDATLLVWCVLTVPV